MRTWTVAACLAAAVVGGGCDFGQLGIAPPANRVFLPSGIAADPAVDLLYVVNSNSDLRFNAGTLVAVDMAQARSVRAAARGNPPSVCPKTRFSRTEPVADDYCCRDLIDSNVINCNEPQFIQSEATVALGSFGSAMQLQPFVRDSADPASELVRRLYVAVRAEPSITFADVTVRQGRASIRCTGPRDGSDAQATGAFCDDNWRLRRPSGVTAGAVVLPEEPHVLSLDPDLGILYVGHLTVTANNQLQGGGVSTLDVCNPSSPDSVRFAGLTRTTFPGAVSQAVAALSPGDPAEPATRLFATARYTPTITGLVLRDPTQGPCTGQTTQRDLTMVPSETFLSSTFLPHGTDLRGVLFSADGERVYVLHRNDPATASSPPALAVMDRTRLPDGSVINTPTGFVEVCSGPTGMLRHDAGRGERIYVTCYDDGIIYVIDPVGLSILAAIDAGAGPTSLVFSPLDPAIAYVASYANSHLSIIDLEPGSPTENHVVLRIGLPHGYGE